MMKLPEKILKLRKQRGMSQEELAEKLNLSRQAVSRWEMGSAQPDASNVLQLSKLFGVTADYLLNDGYESDHDVPAIKSAETASDDRVRRLLALCVSMFGLLGNFILYVLSRFVEVEIPHVFYENGEKLYHWSYEWTGYSYKYFIQAHHLEGLTVLFWGLFLAGMIAALMGKKMRKAWAGKFRKKLGKGTWTESE